MMGCGATGTLGCVALCESSRPSFSRRHFRADLRNQRKDARMAETLQPAVLPRQDAWKQAALAAFAALGIVYGDIGTSTLYGLKQAVEAGGTPTPDAVMGIVSL